MDEEEAVAFKKFLDYLAPDNEQAAVQRYEHLRDAAIKYFACKYFACRNVSDPRACADEVLRVLQLKIAAGRVIEHIESYSLRVAHYVKLRDWKRHQPEVQPSESEGKDKNPGAESPLEILEKRVERNRLSRCLAKCWQTFSDEDRKLMERYGLGSEHHKAEREALAAELGITEEYLRQKIHRLKKKLRACLNDCLKKISRKV